MSKAPAIEYRLFDEIVSGKPADLKKTVVCFSICSRTEMHRRAMAAAVLAWRALKTTPSTAITIHVGGYDEDPRELWEIPEVRTFIRRFCEKTMAHEHPALEPGARALLIACSSDVEVEMITREEALQQTHDFFRKTLARKDD